MFVAAQFYSCSIYLPQQSITTLSHLLSLKYMQHVQLQMSCNESGKGESTARLHVSAGNVHLCNQFLNNRPTGLLIAFISAHMALLASVVRGT